ncbi:MAG: YgiT-type zinc finger protein [bacterium]|nr:YgiT-type zinc finger protein [bacterium]
MVTTTPKETFVPEKVTYTIDVDGKLLVSERVPARVCLETGEQLFSAGRDGKCAPAKRARGAKTADEYRPGRNARVDVECLRGAGNELVAK